MRSYRKVDDHFEIRMDGGRLVLLGVGAALVLVLVFLLGMLVGKGLWGGRRPAPLPLVEEPAPLPPVQPEVPAKHPPKYTFYEDLKKPDVAGIPEADTPTEEPAVPSMSEEEPAAPPPEPALEAKQPIPEPKPEERAPPPPAQPKVPAAVFTVQVGSFRDEAAADALVRKVQKRGIGARVVKASVAGRTWYRVQVGRFETRSEAERHYRTQLKPRGIQGFVTTR